MHPRIEELLAYIDDERANLRLTIDGVPPERRGQSPAPDRWSVAQIVEHLSVVERRIAGMFRRTVAEARAAGVGPETETSSVIGTLDLNPFSDRARRFNAPAASHPSPESDSETAWAALEAARGEFRAAVLEADGLALAEITAPHPAFGKLNLYRWIGFIGAHDARHAQQIREINEQFVQHPA